ncbi:MAG TPA: sigma-70 family RNA polymerase sigma factor [bacterium]|nr:sigma-70 family RNA polymerase sigma factor [bacterium]
MSVSLQDDALIARALEHDEDAWRVLVDRYTSYIYTIALRAFGISSEDAREVVQDSFLRLFAGLPGYRGTGSFRSWLRQIAVNCCLAHLRQRHSAEPLDETVPDPAQQESLERIERGFVLRAAVQNLDEPCRVVVSMFFFEERSYREIAASLGIPEGTVASRLARCVVKLRTAAGEGFS